MSCLWCVTLISPGPLHSPKRREQCRKQLLLKRTGKARDKHMSTRVLLWEFIPDSNRAMSLSSSLVIQRGAVPRKQDFPTTLVTLAVQESSVSNSSSHTEIIIPPSPTPGNSVINLSCFLLLQKKTLASGLISNPCYTNKEEAS